MKLYTHPGATTGRPIMQFIADNNLDIEMQFVDLSVGENLGADYTALNPNQLLPLLIDGDFKLSESSTILRYLADLIDSPAYPKELKLRAKIHEAMDWFNANFFRDWAYGLIYPQVFPPHRRSSEEAQTATILWAKKKSERWLRILDEHFIGPEKIYLCGDSLTLADYFGVAMVTSGELIHCDLSDYPNVMRWLANFKKMPSYESTYAVFKLITDSTKGMSFTAIRPTQPDVQPQS